MRINLSEERKDMVLLSFQRFTEEAFDKGISTFQAERILEFFVGTLGPIVYNQAISDARAFMLDKLDDLDGEYYEPEQTA